MKTKKLLAFTITIITLSSLTACTNNTMQDNKTSASQTPTFVQSNDTSTLQNQATGQIYLYGEQHNVDKIMDKEFELWSEYYHNENMRHLFVEYDYCTAEFLNIWMQSNSDDIINELKGMDSPYTKEFHKMIKKECPETIFHGTGDAYPPTCDKYLEYLETNNLKDSDQYLLVQKLIKKGNILYENWDDTYRENSMTENFIREFNKLDGESVMGIYGYMHTRLEPESYIGSALCLGNQLKDLYGESVHSEDLSYLAKATEPYRVDIITINGKDYKAKCFGEVDLSVYRSEDYLRMDYWQLENAYDDFKDKPKTGSAYPSQSYPTIIETGQVYFIDYTKKDNSVERRYYRFDDDGTTDTLEFRLE